MDDWRASASFDELYQDAKLRIRHLRFVDRLRRHEEPEALPPGWPVEGLKTLLRWADTSAGQSTLAAAGAVRLMTRRAIRAAMLGPAYVTLEEAQALLRGTHETSALRERRGIPDPFADVRPVAIDTWTTICEILEGPNPISSPREAAQTADG